jgi:hypothetical protein
MTGSEMCVCGHRYDEHHIVYWRSGQAADECEFYGFNENGGLILDESGKWVDHCQRFRLAS